MGTVFAGAIVLPVCFSSLMFKFISILEAFHYSMYLGVRWYTFCCSKVWYFGDLSEALLRQS